MDTLTTALISAGSALAGAIIGVAGGMLITWMTTRSTLRAAREARSEERRAMAYVEVIVGWRQLWYSIRQLTFPEENPFPAASGPVAWADTVASASKLSLVGSEGVQLLQLATLLTFEDLREAIVTNLAADEAAVVRAAAEPRVRELFERLAHEIGELEIRMYAELHPGATASAVPWVGFSALVTGKLTAREERPSSPTKES